MPSAHPFVRHTLNLTVGFGGKWWTVIMKTPAHKGKNIFVKNTFPPPPFFHRLNILSLLFSLDFLFFLTTTGWSNGLWTRSKITSSIRNMTP